MFVIKMGKMDFEMLFNPMDVKDAECSACCRQDDKEVYVFFTVLVLRIKV